MIKNLKIIWSRVMKHWNWYRIAIESIGFGLIMYYRIVVLDRRTPPMFEVIASSFFCFVAISLGILLIVAYGLKDSKRRWVTALRLFTLSAVSGVWLVIWVSFTISDLVQPTTYSLNSLFSTVVWFDIMYHAWIEPLHFERREKNAKR